MSAQVSFCICLQNDIMLLSSAPRQSPRMNSGCDPSRWSRPSFICGRQTKRACAAVNPDPSQLRLLTTVEGGRRTWKATSVTVLHTYFLNMRLHTWMHAHTHTHFVCLRLTHTHTHRQTRSCLDAEDKELELWERRRRWRWGVGGLHGWCVCMFVSVCVCFSFFGGGGGVPLYRTSWEAPETSGTTRRAVRTRQPEPHYTNDHKPPEGKHNSTGKWTPHPSKQTLTINELTTRVL